MSEGHNQPKVHVEFTPEEVTWLADRLHEMRQGWNVVALSTQGLSAEKQREIIEKVEDHKRMEAVIRNRILNKADDQGFGHL